MAHNSQHYIMQYFGVSKRQHDFRSEAILEARIRKTINTN